MEALTQSIKNNLVVDSRQIYSPPILAYTHLGSIYRTDMWKPSEEMAILQPGHAGKDV